MFVSKKSKTQDVRLTKEQVEELKKKMTHKERKEFEKRQRQMKMDRLDEALMWGMLFDDEEW